MYKLKIANSAFGSYSFICHLVQLYTLGFFSFSGTHLPDKFNNKIKLVIILIPHLGYLILRSQLFQALIWVILGRNFEMFCQARNSESTL